MWIRYGVLSLIGINGEIKKQEFKNFYVINWQIANTDVILIN